MLGYVSFLLCYVLKTDWEYLLSCSVHQFVLFFLFLPKTSLVNNSVIRHLHISRTTSCSPSPPPKKSIIIVFSFSWGNCNTQEKLTTKFMQNVFFFWGGGGGGKKGVLWEIGQLMYNCHNIFVGHHKFYGCSHVVTNFMSPFTLYLWSCNPESVLFVAG